MPNSSKKNLIDPTAGEAPSKPITLKEFVSGLSTYDYVIKMIK